MTSTVPGSRELASIVQRQSEVAMPPAAAPATPGADEPRPGGSSPRNELLGSLPELERDRLLPHLSLVSLTARDALFEADEPIEHVYFPETSVVSLVSMLRDGGAIEVGSVGREGMVGLPRFLADERSAWRAIAQLPGTAWRIDAGSFLDRARPGTGLHQAMLRYAHLFLTQVAQTAACNGVHVVGQRCARWLLTNLDRVEGDELEITQEFLALLLGVRRAGVSVAINALQRAGMVRTSRGRIRVVDRAALEGVSCDCYAAVRARQRRVIGELARSASDRPA